MPRAKGLINGKPIRRAWVGIDPGAQGAAALIYSGVGCRGEGGLETYDFVCAATAAQQLRDWCDRFEIQTAALERVHSMPKQGVKSTFNFGANYGIWQGLLAALRIPTLFVTPQTWQKGLFGAADGVGKIRSLVVARRIWPTADLGLKKHDGRADALLICRWAKMNQV